jgi:hypothetical protein
MNKSAHEAQTVILIKQKLVTNCVMNKHHWVTDFDVNKQHIVTNFEMNEAALSHWNESVIACQFLIS